jgi:hypothetical protein
MHVSPKYLQFLTRAWLPAASDSGQMSKQRAEAALAAQIQAHPLRVGRGGQPLLQVGNNRSLPGSHLRLQNSRHSTPISPFGNLMVGRLGRLPGWEHRVSDENENRLPALEGICGNVLGSNCNRLHS